MESHVNAADELEAALCRSAALQPDNSTLDDDEIVPYIQSSAPGVALPPLISRSMV